MLSFFLRLTLCITSLTSIYHPRSEMLAISEKREGPARLRPVYDVSKAQLTITISNTHTTILLMIINNKY